ncbi:hypothetical protein BGZ73_007053 [Actinomortierella ambigua]|nr:hypothetical protein BGZ73_007053 [Actinomortierella ambigua]
MCESQCPVCNELYCVCNIKNHIYPLDVHQDHHRMAPKFMDLSETFHSNCRISQVVAKPIIHIPDGDIDVEMFLQQIEEILGPASDEESDTFDDAVCSDGNDDYDDDDQDMADLTEDDETEKAWLMRN